MFFSRAQHQEFSIVQILSSKLSNIPKTEAERCKRTFYNWSSCLKYSYCKVKLIKHNNDNPLLMSRYITVFQCKSHWHVSLIDNYQVQSLPAHYHLKRFQKIFRDVNVKWVVNINYWNHIYHFIFTDGLIKATIRKSVPRVNKLIKTVYIPSVLRPIFSFVYI